MTSDDLLGVQWVGVREGSGKCEMISGLLFFILGGWLFFILGGRLALLGGRLVFLLGDRRLALFDSQLGKLFFRSRGPTA